MKGIFYFGWFMVWFVPYSVSALLNYYEGTPIGLMLICWWGFWLWVNVGRSVYDKKQKEVEK